MTNPNVDALLLSADAVLQRLDEEEQALRDIDIVGGALGKNASDYTHMYSIFVSLVEHIKAIKADPAAFFDDRQRYNDKMLNAYSKLVSTAMKALSELNRMRNADKMTAHILDRHTRDLVQLAAVDIGKELKLAIEAAESGEDGAAIAERLRRLVHRRLPEIFVKSAQETLLSSKDEFGLSVH